MMRWVAIVVLGMVGLFACGCAGGVARSAHEERFEFVRVCMGVRTVVTVYGPDRETALGDAAAAFARIGEMEDVLSDYRPGSEAMRLCAGTTGGVGVPVKVSDDLFAMLAVCERIARATDGAFDVTIGPAVRLWREARRTGVLPSAAEIEQTRESIGWESVRLDSRAQTVTLLKHGMMLDFGGIGKGHAAECAVQVLRARGRGRCLVALAGDIAAGDPPPGERGWKIEIAGMKGELRLANGAVSTAGDAEQFGEIEGVRYSHIIEPRTLVGMTARRMVTVVSLGDGCGARADGLDTPLCVLGAERGRDVVGKFVRTAALVREEEMGAVRVIDPSGVLRGVWNVDERR